MTLTDALSAILLLSGASLSLIAGLAVCPVAGWLTFSLVVALQLLTAPAGAHLVGRAAARAGIARDHLVVDDLPRPRRSPEPP